MTDDEKKLVRKAQARDYYYNWGGKEYQRKYNKLRYQARREKAKQYYLEHREERIAYQHAYYQRKKAENSGKENES